MKAVIVQTLRQLWRDRRLPIALAVLVTLALASLALEAVRSSAREHDRQAAEQLDAKTFREQGARNPHSVAHFSRFAFLPRVITNALDTGVSDHVGAAIWMEAHARDPANARPAEDQIDIGRIALLDLAWIWQVVVPLLLIALGFDAISRERERRTLALIVVGGGTISRFVAGKMVAFAGLFAVLLATSGPVALGVATGLDVPDAWGRITWWVAGHLAYVMVWVVLTLAASARARSSRAALVWLLALWAAAVLIAPRMIATMVDERIPAPSGADLRARIDRDLEEGFDGHGGAGERAKELEQRVLARYGVKSIDDLPVSFAGLRLDEGERVGNLVFDRRYRELAETYERQRTWRRRASILTPLPVLQHVSMAAAGTDVEHHMDFAEQAEAQRRDIISRLNADMTLHGKGKDFDYMADPALWATIPEFRYTPPALDEGAVGRDVAVLGGWLAVAGLLLLWATRRLHREVLA